MSILSVAGSGKFSSDRTIREYAEDIWDVKPCRRPMSKSSAPAKKPFGNAEEVSDGRAREWTKTGRPARRLKKVFVFHGDAPTHRTRPTNPARPTTRSKDTAPALTTLPRIYSPPSPRRTSRDRVGVPSRRTSSSSAATVAACARISEAAFRSRAPRRVPDDPRVPPRDVPRAPPRSPPRAPRARGGVVGLPGRARATLHRRSPSAGDRGARRPRTSPPPRRVSIVNLGASRHEHGRDKLGARARARRGFPGDSRPIFASPRRPPFVPRDIARAPDAHPPRRRVRQNLIDVHARERHLRAVKHGIVLSVRVPASHARDGRAAR